jgi:monovalent cation:H+ antiporter-2, CPA2 family
LQVLAGLSTCFVFAFTYRLLHLSATLGALPGGIFISQTTTLNSLEESLELILIFFVVLFFFSIRLQINLRFVFQHPGLIDLIVMIILVVNNLINAFIFGYKWEVGIIVYTGCIVFADRRI